jgi:hypothetical protein
MNGVAILPVSTLASHKDEFGKNKKYQCTEKQNEQFSVFFR